MSHRLQEDFDNIHFSDAGEENFTLSFPVRQRTREAALYPIKAGADTGRACPMQTYGQR
jgi:hypothetical protein